MTVPYALSVHNFIKNVGADAGFASIIGLAVLILLYFAQMRETSTLRDRLDEALGRVGQLENRLAQLARLQQTAASAGPQQPAVAPRPVVPLRPMGSVLGSLRSHPANAVNAGVQPRPVPVLTGPPAGVGSPALGSATKLIPTPATAEPAAVPAATPLAVPAADVASARVGAAQTAAGGAATVVQDTVLFSSPVDAPPANGHATPPPVVGPPLTGAGFPAVGVDAFDLDDHEGPLEPGDPAPPPRVHFGRHSAQAGIPRRTAALPRGAASEPRGPSVWRRLAFALVGLALVAVIVVVLLSVTGGAKQTPTAATHHAKHKTTESHKAKPAAFNPADTTVAILNGTSIYHLAQDVANKLVSHGYKQGAVANAPSQTQAATVVGYLTGHQTAADEVAAALNLSPTAVQPASQSAIVACANAPTSGGTTSTSSSCPADVIVTVGADLQKDATGTTTE